MGCRDSVGTHFPRPQPRSLTVPTAAPALSVRQAYFLPRETLDLRTDDPRLIGLADRLWRRVAGGSLPAGAPICLDLRVDDGGDSPLPLTESWTVGAEHVTLELGNHLSVSVDVGAGRVTARVCARLLEQDPGLVARLMLEVPVAALLQRRSYAAVHAAGVAGPGGAVVLRGAPGSGKSTLAAAAHLAGMDVLGDESVLVARDDPDDLLAAVRDPVLEPDTARILGLTNGLSPATERVGPKGRLDLFASAVAVNRPRRRVATVILGPREGAARLDRMDPGTFIREFRHGGIREERWAAPAPAIETAWSRSGAYRLTGAEDLTGAIALLSELVGHSPSRGSRV